jgi:hypothetical protein
VPRRVLPALLRLGLLLLLATGCGLTVQQRSAVERFGAATVDFAALASGELVKSRTDVVDMNTLRAKLGDPALAADAALDEHFSVAQVKVRTDALKALEEYGALLQTLVSASQTEQLQTAADGFVASLRKVNGVSLSDGQAGAIGEAVRKVGGLLVEYMRAEATRQIVTDTQPHVSRVLQLIRRDFDPLADHWSLGYDKVVVALDGAAARAERIAGLPAGTPPNPAAVALVGEARAVGRRNAARVKAVSAQVLDSAAKLAEAQKNLRYAVQATTVSFDEVNDYVSQVEDFVRIYAILRDR